MSKIIDGKKLAHTILQEVQRRAMYIKDTYNIVPYIVSILVGYDHPSEIYLHMKMQTARKLGVIGKIIRFSKSITQIKLIHELRRLNNNKITGLLVQLPLPQHLNHNTILHNIDSNKDIDAVSVYHAGLLYNKQNFITSCTAQGIMYVLKYYLDKLTGKKVVVIGRSQIVGRPIAAMLLNENCTVTQIHSKTRNIAKECHDADIIIVAIGMPKFLQAHWVKKGCFVIDVGINKEEGFMVGDTHFKDLLAKVSYITPVPGGVGPLTVAFLLLNTLKLCYIHNRLDWNEY